MTLTNDIHKALEYRRLNIAREDFSIVEIRVNEKGHEQLAKECSETSGVKVDKVVSLEGITVVVSPLVPSDMCFVIAKKGEGAKCKFWEECPTPNWYGKTMRQYIREVCLTEKHHICAHYDSLEHTTPDMRKKAVLHIKAHPHYANRYVETKE